MHVIPRPFLCLLDVNLNVIDTFRREFQGLNIGYSGHESGYIPTLGAVAKGAVVIERHFTLDKSMKGSDHSASLDPSEFAEMVRNIRILEAALGSHQKSFLPAEGACFGKLGKSVVAGHNLLKGTVLTLNHLKIKVSEPHGWPAKDIDSLIGKTLLRDVDEDDVIANHLFCHE